MRARKAMIFAAGLGTRLRPFTLEHPKALVPVGGVPMLQRVIERLKAAGVDEIVVNTHHFADQIVQFLIDRRCFGITIHVSDETSLLLDTGGGLLAARPWLEGGDEPFIVHNADILTDFDIEAMVSEHERTQSMATLLVARRDTRRYLLFDDSLTLRGWTNTATSEVRPSELDAAPLHRYAFGGVHVLHPRIFGLLEAYYPAGVPFSITDFYIDTCTLRSPQALISGYLPHEQYYWHDIGKADTLSEAESWISGHK